MDIIYHKNTIIERFLKNGCQPSNQLRRKSFPLANSHAKSGYVQSIHLRVSVLTEYFSDRNDTNKRHNCLNLICALNV